MVILNEKEFEVVFLLCLPSCNLR